LAGALRGALGSVAFSGAGDSAETP